MTQYACNGSPRSGDCGYSGQQSRTRLVEQLGSCPASNCADSRIENLRCITPCVSGTATGSGCACMDGFNGKCCENGMYGIFAYLISSLLLIKLHCLFVRHATCLSC